MEVISYIDPILRNLMIILTLVFFVLSIIGIFKKRSNLFFSGAFIAIADSRYFSELSIANINFLLYLIFIWLILYIIRYKRIININETLLYWRKNKLSFIAIFIIYVFLHALILRGFIFISHFINIYLAYLLLLLPQKTSKNFELELKSFLNGFILAVFIYGILLYIYAYQNYITALGDVTVSSTIVAILMSFGLIFILSKVIYSKITLTRAIVITVFLFLLVITYSRSAFFSLIVSLAFVFVKYGSKVKIKGSNIHIIHNLFFLSIFVLLIYQIPTLFQQRNLELSGNILGILQNQFQNSRMSYIQDVLFHDMPDYFIGKGLGHYLDVSRAHGLYRIESFWIELLAETGLLGLLLFVIGYFKSFLFQVRKFKNKFDLNTFIFIWIFVFLLLNSPFSFSWLNNTPYMYAYIFIWNYSVISNESLNRNI